jgi:LPXTG-motif cell wall-anchored protein
MTPARSLAASVIALGFASSLTAPLPAFATSAPCERAENYAAQSGAEMLRIDRLDLHSSKDLERPRVKSSSSSSGDSSGGAERESATVTDSTDDLLGPDADLTGGDLGNSGQGATGFLSGTSDLLKSITDGGVTAPLSTGGQGGGGSVTEGDISVGGVGLGEARTALIGNARANSAAVARMVDGTGPGSLTKPLEQQAPPAAGRGLSRSTPASTVGPLTLGRGELDAGAQWDAAMACGNTAGEAARSSASLGRVDLLRTRDGALVGVPDKISSLSTTALERRGSEPRTVASATVSAGRLTLADGKIRVRVLRAPMLTVSMATGSGGEVRYQPAVVEVAGPGITTKRLSAVGDSVDISLGDVERSSESTPLGGLPSLNGLLPGAPLPLPTVPGLPSLGAPDSESAPAVGDGTKVRISLGEVRQATNAHAIAATAAAIKIAVSACFPADADDHSSGARNHKGYGGPGGSSLVAELGFGVLEAAAVAPEAPVINSGVSASGGGLPVTGPQAGLIAIGGAGLLAAGGAALFLTRRRRRSIS